MKTKNKQKNKIPDGWKIDYVKNIFSVKSGAGFKAGEYTEHGVPLVQIENVGHGEIKWNNKIYLPENYLLKYPDLHLKEGDIVLALNRPITRNKLKIAQITDIDSPCILYQRVGKIIPKLEVVDSKYLYQISKKFLKRFVLDQSVGSDQPYIAMSDLYKYKFILPPLPEQKRIVGVLEVWDEVLEKLKREIEIKKNIKKGLMQELLTGKRRIGGFNGEWEIKKLGEIGEVRTSSVDKKSVAGEKQISLLNYMDVYKRDHIFQDDKFQQVTAKDTQITSSNLKQGDILFTPSSETPDDIGHSAVVMEDLEKILFSYHLMRFRPKNNILDYNFSAYAFKGFKFYKELWRKAQGATRYTLSKDAVETSKIIIPESLKEQKAIADILMSADEELEELLRKQKLLEDQKKYLLNNLISGEIRTPENLLDLVTS